MTTPNQEIWNELEKHAENLRQRHLIDLFSEDDSRASRYFINAAGISLDYSKNFFTAETEQLLETLCNEAELPRKVLRMFQGEEVNTTEQRAALHTLLRQQDAPAHLQEAFASVKNSLQQIEEMSSAIRGATWLGATGKPIRNILHIGIGGSYLGPAMVDEALSSQRDPEQDIQCHFIANVDAHHITQVMQQLDPAETLVVIVSKTFSTLETRANADSAKRWLRQSLSDLKPHLIAVSANTSAATEFGVDPENVLPMWDWVGGRYSLWSAVGVTIAIRYGFDAFQALLRGAAEMDEHFLHTPTKHNIPVILGFLGLLYQHCFNSGSHAVLTYDHRLRLLPEHLQQVDMESNGKSVKVDGTQVGYQTGAVIWGGEGTNGQHAFHQLLHQGTRFTSVDFILTLCADHDLKDHHDKLIASALSQSQALMIGRSDAQLHTTPENLRPHKVMPGNKPSNTLLLDHVDAASIGALIAMYEHKVFVQAMIWEINPFDQWGVELGKELGEQILQVINGDQVTLDPSTNHLLARYLQARENPPS